MNWPDETLADFQETYGIDIWPLCQGVEPLDVWRISVLAWQLPNTSRLWRAVSPAGGYDTDTQLLRELEYDVRHFAWSFSKDAKHGANEPERMTLPGEEEAGKRAEEEADHDAIELARVFGLNI